jgi:hypothetical protein
MNTKKDQLKNLFKPIIKECVKELILEEGVLSSLISEVQKTNKIEKKQTVVDESVQRQEAILKNKTKIDEAKKRIYSALGSDSYSSIFENIEPLTSYEAGESPVSMGDPLSGLAPSDPGVDISSIPGMNMWKTLVTDKKR